MGSSCAAARLLAGVNDKNYATEVAPLGFLGVTPENSRVNDEDYASEVAPEAQALKDDIASARAQLGRLGFCRSVGTRESHVTRTI